MTTINRPLAIAMSAPRIKNLLPRACAARSSSSRAPRNTMPPYTPMPMPLASGIGIGVYGGMVLRGAREEEDLAAQARGRRFLILGALIAIASGLLIVVISFIYG